MIRRREPIAVAAALFALQMPLCALACLPDSAPAPMIAAEHGGAPCHEQTPDSAPAKPADSHADCACEESYTPARIGVETANSSGALEPDALAANASTRRLAVATVHIARPPLEETDLPPPDILLLKSSFLI